MLQIPIVQVARGDAAWRGRCSRSQRGRWCSFDSRLSALGSSSGSFSRSLVSARRLTVALGRDSRAPAQSEQTLGDCTSLQRRGWRVVWQIHEIQAWEVWAYHEKTRIKCLLQHFPLSNIACCNLAQDKIIFIWVALRRKRTIRAEKDRKKQLAKEAALASQSLASAAVWIFIILIGFWRHKSVNMLKYAKTKYAPWHVCKNLCDKNMQKICTNMQNQICTNMHFKYIYMYKFACYMHFICVICLNIHKGKYGLICRYMQIKMHTMCTQICTKHSQNMHKICSGRTVNMV